MVNNEVDKILNKKETLVNLFEKGKVGREGGREKEKEKHALIYAFIG